MLNDRFAVCSIIIFTFFSEFAALHRKSTLTQTMSDLTWDLIVSSTYIRIHKRMFDKWGPLSSVVPQRAQSWGSGKTLRMKAWIPSYTDPGVCRVTGTPLQPSSDLAFVQRLLFFGGLFLDQINMFIRLTCDKTCFNLACVNMIIHRGLVKNWISYGVYTFPIKTYISWL